jgi:hypothetical protein
MVPNALVFGFMATEDDSGSSSIVYYVVLRNPNDAEAIFGSCLGWWIESIVVSAKQAYINYK